MASATASSAAGGVEVVDVNVEGFSDSCAGCGEKALCSGAVFRILHAEVWIVMDVFAELQCAIHHVFAGVENVHVPHFVDVEGGNELGLDPDADQEEECLVLGLDL